jgi:hypothetical protein
MSGQNVLEVNTRMEIIVINSITFLGIDTVKVKIVKINFALEQAMKAQRGE